MYAVSIGYHPSLGDRQEWQEGMGGVGVGRDWTRRDGSDSDTWAWVGRRQRQAEVWEGRDGGNRKSRTMTSLRGIMVCVSVCVGVGGWKGRVDVGVGVQQCIL